MKLYGSFLSPYTRRIYIALHHYGMPFELFPKMTGPDEAEIRTQNPLGRLPFLLLDDGTSLVDSVAILDLLEEMAPEDKRTLPEAGPERRDVLQVVSLGLGIADKALSRFYEGFRRPSEFTWEGWRERCAWQVQDGLKEIERRYEAGHAWLDGDRLSMADIMTVVALNFAQKTNADLFERPAPRRIMGLSDRLARDFPFVAESDPRLL